MRRILVLLIALALGLGVGTLGPIIDDAEARSWRSADDDGKKAWSWGGSHSRGRDDDDDDGDGRTRHRYHDRPKPRTILDVLEDTDGAQALVAAMMVADKWESGCAVNFTELLSDRRADIILFAPVNSAFEKLWNFDPGGLNGLTIPQIQRVLPFILENHLVGAEDLCQVLLNHVSVSPRSVNAGNASAEALLRLGRIPVEDEDESVLPVSVNRYGITINYEGPITERDVFTVNGVVHYLMDVIVQAPSDDPEPPPDDSMGAIEEWCSRDACLQSDAQFDRCVAFMGVCLVEAQNQIGVEKCAVAGLLVCSEISPGDPGGPGGPGGP